MGSNLTGTIGSKNIIGTLGSGHIVMGKNVIPDWNQNDPSAEDYIKNRPGGYTVTIPEINIQWDGVIGDRVVAVNRSPYSPKPNFVKVSDEIPAKEDLIGASILFVKDGEEITYSFNDSSNTIRMDEAYSGEGYSVQIEGAQDTVQFIVISKVPAKTHIGFVEYSETGVYFYQFNNVYVRSLVRESYKKNITIPQKYIEGLPDISELTKNVMVNGDESIALKSPNKEFKMTVDNTGVPSFTDTGDATNKFTPVKDVQVAGSSVLDGGVANVPIASETNCGVVKVYDWGGTRIDENKRLCVFQSGNHHIANRVSRTVIVPENLDYAVKAAMCDGKGAAWTEDEQKAARERMGIDKPYELIEEITIAEENVSAIARDVDRLCSAKLVIICPPMESIITANALVLFGNAGKPKYIYLFGEIAPTKVGVYRHITLEAELRNNYWRAYKTAENDAGSMYPNGSWTTGVSETAPSRLMQLPSSDLDAITKITINAFPTDAYIPVGTKITIYGVRA